MPKMFRTIFCGTPSFAVPALQALIEDPAFAVTHVITQPDKPVGRKQILEAPPVKTVAGIHAIPVCQPDHIRRESLPFEDAPDYLVTVAYGQILAQDMLSFPKIAAVNVHPSLLPCWRGASPIQNALLAADAVTGVTIQLMVKELDAGPILAQKEILVDERETAVSLHEKLSNIGASLLIETLKKPLTPQDQDSSKATYCQKLTREDGDVDPKTMDAEQIDRTVRALVPWPGVRCAIRRNSVKILETSLVPTEDSCALPCARDSVLHIVRLQPPGKKPMTGAEWLRGRS